MCTENELYENPSRYEPPRCELMSAAHTVKQALPTTSESSVDVLNSLKGIVPSVIFDMLTARVALGEKKYGKRLETNNGRDSLVDGLQEALDSIMYSRQAQLEGHDDGGLLSASIGLVILYENQRVADGALSKGQVTA